MELVQVINEEGENEMLLDVSSRPDDWESIVETAFKSVDSEDYLAANGIERVYVTEFNL